MRILRFAAFAACLLLGGCGTLPDGRPFADASNAMTLAVSASGNAVSDSLRDVTLLVPAAEAQPYLDSADKLEKAWAVRIQAAEGAAAYSQAIAELIAAGNSGAATANQLGDGLEKLAATAGISLAAPAVGVAGDVARFLITQIAIVRASKTLEIAVHQAQPAVDRIAWHLASDAMRSMKTILRATLDNAQSAINHAYDDDNNYFPALKSKRDAIRTAAVTDPRKISELMTLEHLLDTVGSRLKSRDLKLEKAATDFKARAAVLSALNDSTIAWALAHRDLAAAIKEKRKVTVAELQRTVGELRDLVKKVRAL